MSKIFQVTNLDHDAIKESLKDYLRTKPEFSDFDFEGSNISSLLNILAYNTHYNALLTNAAFNETFLDTAIKRSSVVSRANELGYLPKSDRSARAYISMSVTENLTKIPILDIPEYTQFKSKIQGRTYSFYNIESYNAVAGPNSSYQFPNVELLEGTKLNFSFIADGTKYQKFVIPNKGIDTTTIRVLVRESVNSNVTNKFFQFVDLQQTDSNSRIFYLEENSEGFHVLRFGDNVFGKKLEANNIVQVDYIVPSGEEVNVSNTISQSFSLVSSITGLDGRLLIGTLSNSSGASARESVEEIRYNSRLSFERQNRIITENDFYSYINENYSGIDSISIYGGEKANPPVYGKVFISIKSQDNVSIGETVKMQIAQDLRQYMTVTVIPEFIDPDITHVSLSVIVKYNKAMTARSEEELKIAVLNNITNYFNVSISKFRKSFYYSKLTRVIDETDSSIFSSFVSIGLQKRMTPILQTNIEEDIKFSVKLVPGSFYSNNFFTSYIGDEKYIRIIDDNGVLKSFDINSNKILSSNVGTIDYSTGKVVLSNINISRYSGTEVSLKLNATPLNDNSDVVPETNQILVLDNSGFDVDSGIKAGLNILMLNEK